MPSTEAKSRLSVGASPYVHVSDVENSGSRAVVRLIGNKSKLVGEIEKLLTDRGITGGTFIDIFTGTASVARHFKTKGFRVIANDLLAMCYAQAVATVEVSGFPRLNRWADAHRAELESDDFRKSFEALTHPDASSVATRVRRSAAARRVSKSRQASLPLRRCIHFLNERLAPREGMVYRSFSVGGGSDRQYFSAENGRRIDAILHHLRSEYLSGVLERRELYVLVAALLDAADRVANISGTYGAFLKRLQPNAAKRLELQVPEILHSRLSHRAFCRDANDLIREIEGDTLYVDPPYNRRQYAANYHVLQIIAEYHTIEDLPLFEASLYGKTGLRPYDALRSLFCVPASERNRETNVFSAFSRLILESNVSHVVVSYNEEGLLSREQIGSILAEFSGRSRFDYSTGFREVRYKRFRSDSDRTETKGTGAKRQYKVLEGKAKDQVGEWLFFASRLCD